MQCANCRSDIGVGDYIRYKGMNFCDRECLAEYLLNDAEDDIVELWNDSEENLAILAAEEKEEIRKDLGGWYE